MQQIRMIRKPLEGVDLDKLKRFVDGALLSTPNPWISKLDITPGDGPISAACSFVQQIFNDDNIKDEDLAKAVSLLVCFMFEAGRTQPICADTCGMEWLGVEGAETTH